MKRKNSQPFETTSSGGKGPFANDNSQPGLVTPQRRRDGGGLNKSLIVQNSASSQQQLINMKPVLKKKKQVVVTKRVVKKRVPRAEASQPINEEESKVQATPDRHQRLLSRSGGITKTTSSDGRLAGKSPTSNRKKSGIRTHNKTPSNTNSLLSMSSDAGQFRNQRQQSVPMLRKENQKVVSKKRIGTPIKVKPNYHTE